MLLGPFFAPMGGLSWAKISTTVSNWKPTFHQEGTVVQARKKVKKNGASKFKKCEPCNITFKSISLLIHHVDETHKVDGGYECKKCDSVIQSRYDWHNHFHNVHGKTRNHGNHSNFGRTDNVTFNNENEGIQNDNVVNDTTISEMIVEDEILYSDDEDERIHSDNVTQKDLDQEDSTENHTIDVPNMTFEDIKEECIDATEDTYQNIELPFGTNVENICKIEAVKVENSSYENG